MTGRLAEFALRRLLDDLAPRAGFSAEVAVLPISVAALMTPRWVARHLEIPAGIERVILPGYCRGDLTAIAEKAPACTIEPGPEDLRDLPRHFGTDGGRTPATTAVRHRDPGRDQPRPEAGSRTALCRAAEHFRSQGADVIDLGCDPGNDVAAGRRCRGRASGQGPSGLDRQLRSRRRSRWRLPPGPSLS